jgi:hypothetical protein
MVSRNAQDICLLNDQRTATVVAGWLVGVLVQLREEAAPLLHYFAVGHADQGKCEWTAVDHAAREGLVATGPVGGQEPVRALRALSLGKMSSLGLKPGEVRALGWRHPRRWLTG